MHYLSWAGMALGFRDELADVLIHPALKLGTSELAAPRSLTIFEKQRIYLPS